MLRADSSARARVVLFLSLVNHCSASSAEWAKLLTVTPPLAQGRKISSAYVARAAAARDQRRRARALSASAVNETLERVEVDAPLVCWSAGGEMLVASGRVLCVYGKLLQADEDGTTTGDVAKNKDPTTSMRRRTSVSRAVAGDGMAGRPEDALDLFQLHGSCAGGLMPQYHPMQLWEMVFCDKVSF